VPDKVSTIIAALRAGIGENQMMAYLVEMAVRLVELHRVLKPTGSLYLHCDPTASHYLKLVLDGLFGPMNFRNEIIWKRTSAHSDAKRFGRVHDTILFYSKTDAYPWNQSYEPLPQKTIDDWYNNVEPETGRRFNRADLTAAGLRDGFSGKPWRGIDPSTKGNHWRIPQFLPDIVAGKNTQEALDALDAAGRIFWPKAAGGIPMLKRYVEEATGIPLLDVMTDISPLQNKTSERLGFPTQKPLALLERLIAAGSNPGDVVLDPFCGCGTALIGAEKLGRRWIGIDITYLSIAVMKSRLKDSFGIEVPVIGQPTEVEGARQLAQGDDGRYQFQWWALNLIDARPLGNIEKKGADRGIDGRITFTVGAKGEMGQALVSVKSGGVNSGMIRDLKGTIQREGAQIGLFITLEEPSKPMLLEASTAGVYTSPISGKDYPRIQILSIRQLLEEHAKPMLPLLLMPTYQQAERIPAKEAAEQKELFG
jgi:DNA modification methylase